MPEREDAAASPASVTREELSLQVPLLCICHSSELKSVTVFLVGQETQTPVARPVTQWAGVQERLGHFPPLRTLLRLSSHHWPWGLLTSAPSHGHGTHRSPWSPWELQAGLGRQWLRGGWFPPPSLGQDGQGPSPAWKVPLQEIRDGPASSRELGP